MNGSNAEIRMLSFADSRMRFALDRIGKQAEELKLFDRILLCDENDLEAEFRSRWAEKLRRGVRGFGYWCWKPHLIRRELASMPEGGILFYCDAGCHLNPRGRERFLAYLSELEKSPAGVLAFTVDDVQQDYRWTKGDALDYFHCRERRDITHTPSVSATHVFFRHCPQAMAFLDAWNAAWESDFSLIDDTPSRRPSLPGFEEHRHDQSLFSLLYKREGFPALSGKETHADDWSVLADYPILDMRDRRDHKCYLRRLRRWRFLARYTTGALRRKYENKYNALMRTYPFLRDEIDG